VAGALCGAHQSANRLQPIPWPDESQTGDWRSQGGAEACPTTRTVTFAWEGEMRDFRLRTVLDQCRRATRNSNPKMTIGINAIAT
jgi:hypothetical protein